MDITTARMGEEHPDLAQRLNNLADLLYHQVSAQSRTHLVLPSRSEPLQDTCNMTDGSTDPSSTQGKYQEAEPLYRRAMTITEKTLGVGHPDFAQRLNNLAVSLESQVRAGLVP